MSGYNLQVVAVDRWVGEVLPAGRAYRRGLGSVSSSGGAGRQAAHSTARPLRPLLPSAVMWCQAGPHQADAHVLPRSDAAGVHHGGPRVPVLLPLGLPRGLPVLDLRGEQAAAHTHGGHTDRGSRQSLRGKEKVLTALPACCCVVEAEGERRPLRHVQAPRPSEPGGAADVQGPGRAEPEGAGHVRGHHRVGRTLPHGHRCVLPELPDDDPLFDSPSRPRLFHTRTYGHRCVPSGPLASVTP